MKSIVITDNLDVTFGFRLSGIESKVLTENDDVVKVIEDFIKDQEIGLVLVSETLTRKNYDEIVNLKLRTKGTIISILPELGDKFSSGIESYVSQAIGIKV